MNEESLTFLEALLAAPSPSGYEGPARNVWRDTVTSWADEVVTDVHGNAIATVNPGGAPHVVLAGHIDELGFQICHIEQSGLLRFRTIGGHDLRAIAGRRVWIHTGGKPVLGVIGKKPIHLLRDRQRNNAPKESELWIDAGFRSAKEAARLVEIGDPATYVDGFAKLRNKLAVARGLDNKAGAFVVGRVLHELHRAKKLAPRVTAVATVQEEIGLRGARTSAFGLQPDIGIAVDVTWATDNPGGTAAEIGEVTLGKGPVLVRGPNANPPLLELLRSTAKARRVPVQMRALPRPSGNDANALQLTRAGVAAAVIGIPQRYMHSPVEICHLGDLDNAVKLLAAAIRKITPRTSFIPA